MTFALRRDRSFARKEYNRDMKTQNSWPGHLASAYHAAAVRLTSLMQNRKQYLLFGCVELYPNEIPAPPSKIKPQTLAIHGATAVSTVTVMSVPQGLAWYESALNGSRLTPIALIDLSCALG
jgi:hypothetical protein